MDLKIELLSNAVAELIVQKIDMTSIDFNKIVDSTAVIILSEIKKIIQDDTLSDFEVVERIVIIFEKYGINADFRHDFG